MSAKRKGRFGSLKRCNAHVMGQREKSRMRSKRHYNKKTGKARKWTFE